MPPFDGLKSAVYATEVLAEVPRLLSLLDREAQSAGYGSFDREHWAWKFRDFPLTMMQVAVYPLALLWHHPFPNNSYYRNSQCLRWIEAAIENTICRQHKNGSFDSVGPYTQDHGVSLAIAYALTETLRLMGDHASSSLRESVVGTVRKSCDFALRSSEDYAFITNHQALFAVAFLNAHDLLGEIQYYKQAEEIVELILSKQSPDGWYLEYEGADPGYESLGIFYLAQCWKRTRSPQLLESLRRSIEFFAHCVHPDGSVGGVYGSRHTSLYFPGGFEMLAGEIPLAASISQFMRERLARRNVVTPTTSDAENLPSLIYTYLEACLTPADRERGDLPKVPCETLDGLIHFSDSGITVAGTSRYYAVSNTGKGGVICVFNKRTDVIAYEDAGYIVRTGNRRWSSQLIGLGHRVEASGKNEIACTTQLAEIRQQLPSPARFVLLRLLHLTLFRSLMLGAWLRRLIIKQLITKKHLGPLRMRRSITFGPDEVHFCDVLEATEAIHVDDVDLPRRFLAIHMGSAKYFHPSELEHTPLPASVREMARELNGNHIAKRKFTLRFSAPPTQKSAVEVVVGKMDFMPQ